jgi:hypothetical protein
MVSGLFLLLVASITISIRGSDLPADNEDSGKWGHLCCHSFLLLATVVVAALEVADVTATSRAETAVGGKPLK